MSKNTQQPVAWMYEDAADTGYIALVTKRWRPELLNGWVETPLHTAPPVLRDVLMAVAEEVRASLSAVVCDSSEPWVASSQFDLDAIVDRYASQVQPEQTYAADAAMEGMKRLGYRWRDGAWYKNATQPEPVNQQTLAALKAVLRLHQSYSLNDTADELIAANAAIAAAEAAQPVGQRECGCGWRGDSADCVWCGSVGPLCPECRETTEVAQQPASAQPVAVPDAEIIQCFETEMARNPAAYDQPGEVVYQITQKELVRAARAMLSAAQKPEGGE